MSEDKTTERPWFIQRRNNDWHPYIVATTGFRYGMNIVYGKRSGGGAYFIGHEDVCRANAELIVKAVNTYDEALHLADAARALANSLPRMGTWQPGELDLCMALAKYDQACNAAILALEGEEATPYA